MPISISGTNGITLDGQFNSASSFGFKNRIINGAMVIDQRSSSTSAVTVNSVTKAYATDRFCGTGIGSAGVFTLAQVTTAPSNYINSLKANVTTADSSLAATDLYRIMHLIEGLNCADLGWGTATAKTVTLSFYVYSNLTGTFGGSIINSAVNRSYPFSYTISAANIWEQKTITIPGDTSGTWLTTTGIGISINWGLGVGSTYSGTANEWAGAQYYSVTGATNVMGTLSNTFFITGVQLEVGSTATSFDYRPYGTELALCQRYYETSRGTASTFTQSTTIAYPVFVTDTNRTSGRQFAVAKRSAPTVTIYSRNNTSGKVSTVAAGTDNAGTASATSISETGWSNTNIGTATTAGVGIEVAYAADSEL